MEMDESDEGPDQSDDSLTVEMGILADHGYKLLDFLGTQNITADCREFTLRVMDTDNNFEKLYSIYLHRIQTSGEGIPTVKETYGQD